MRRFNGDRSFIRPPRFHNAHRIFLARCLHRLSAHVLASAPRGASPHHHGQVSPQRPALATRQRHGMAHPDPQLPPSHRCGSTSAPSSNRWARDLPPSRRRPRTPTPLHTRLLLRGQHPPPRRLRGGSRHSHHPRNLLPPTHTDAPIRAYPTMSNPSLVRSPTHTGETAPRPHTTPHRSSRRTSSTHDCRRPCQPNDYEESKPSSTPPGSRVQTRPSSTYSPTSSSPPRPHGMDQSHYRGSSSPL